MIQTLVPSSATLREQIHLILAKQTPPDMTVAVHPWLASSTTSGLRMIEYTTPTVRLESALGKSEQKGFANTIR